MNKLLVISILFFISSKGFAQSFVGPQASAIGGAGIAAVVPGESALLNPASVSFFKEYYATGFFSSGSHPNEGDRQQLGALLSDGSPDRIFQGSLAYVRSTSSPVGTNEVRTQDIHITGSNFVWKNVAFGISAHRFVYHRDGVPESTQYNGGAGILYVFSNQLTFGLVASDILKSMGSGAVPPEGRLNKTYGLGASYIFEDKLGLRLDITRPTDNNPNHNSNIMGGFESEWLQFFAFRSGFRWEEAVGPEKRVFTAGLGFKGPKLRADYGFEKDTEVAGGVRHSFDLWMSF